MYVDPAVGQWGLENFLVAIGGDVIEVVAPIKPGTSTTAGRLLQRRGEGGYMIIMQTDDAESRRRDIENRQKGSVIYSHSFDHRYKNVRDRGVCIQYHPKIVRGGMMPELDSHFSEEWNPTPLETRFSPWHPCGDDYFGYLPKMKSTGHLWLRKCTLALGGGDSDTVGAAREWGDVFGLNTSKNEVVFTNARMAFVAGEEGVSEGLRDVTIGVQGRAVMDGILERARQEGICGDGWFEMVGVRWYLVLMNDVKARI